MKHSFLMFVAFISTTSAIFAQQRSPFKAITSTQYTAHTELFAEFRPLMLNTPARFTAHLTKVGEQFKPYAEAEVSLKLDLNGKTAWQQTLTQPAAPGIYRFPVKAETAGTGKVTITLKMPGYTEEFIIDNVVVYPDSASAVASQASLPAANTAGEITYAKEKSWLENFATAPVTVVKKKVMVPQAALVAEGGTTYVIVQRDPEHFRKQAVEVGGQDGASVEIKTGLTATDRIVVTGADKVK